MKGSMKNFTTNIFGRCTKFLGAMTMAALMMHTAMATGPAAVSLGTAGTYRILAKTGVTTTGTTTITGNIGISPGVASSITGFGLSMDGTGTFSTSSLVTGNIYASDYTSPTPSNLTTSVSNMEAAYTDAAGRVTPDFTNLGSAGEINGLNLTPGLYKWTTGVTVSSNVTITGSATDTWIFQIAGTLGLSSGATVTLSGGALASNIVWVVSGQVTLGSTAAMKGVILGQTAIVFNNGATLDGRALAQANVTLIGNTVLPVELVSFTASANRMNADLNWSTATEVNNFGFDVERKTSNNWNKVGFVEGNGTTNSSKNYSYADNNLTSGKYSYRLKQIDRDGKFEYSQSVEVTIGQVPKEFALLQNYPNPFNPSTMISYQLPANSHISLKVYDMLGNEVATLVNQTKEAGSYTAEFDGSQLSSGVYFYTINAGSFSATKKLTLLK